jgi:hypothetical protein
MKLSYIPELVRLEFNMFFKYSPDKFKDNNYHLNKI